MQLCNFIAGSEDGLADFIKATARNYENFSEETKLIITNIDDLLFEFDVPQKLISETNEYLRSHNITTFDLANMVNSNVDISNRDFFNEMPENIWYMPQNTIATDEDNQYYIKCNVPQTYIDDLLAGKILKFHRVIIEAILYALYTLGKEENPHPTANDKLYEYHINPMRNTFQINSDDDIYKQLEPDTAKALCDVVKSIKFSTLVLGRYGSRTIKKSPII